MSRTKCLLARGLSAAQCFVVGLGAAMLAACASAPETRPDQQALEARADAVVQTMVARDPTLADLLEEAPGYVVFPTVAEAGFIVGGSNGIGVVYENGRATGYSELYEGTVGLQLGGQSFSELVVFQTQNALDRFKTGNFDLTAGVTATAIQSGAAASTRFEGGVAVFIDDETGLMAGATVGGQTLSYTSK